ncbi:AbrB/MazE/SpoVT family DNA-binding domain-containing protein [Candidatus Woesearchaeota archaeon]|nr:AbrB/MazE/SpoVT family DNA-binding domain-containing protein [Candidatus Woesearchaeota archaeon]
MGTMIEMGKISSRGQVAIPTGIRNHLGLNEGSKVLFFTDDNSLVIKKITEQTFADITKPPREAKKKIKEKDVPGMIHRLRNSKR